MTCRVEVSGGDTTTWVYDYNDANRLWKIRDVTGSCGSPGSDIEYWIFTYDGDGIRVKEDHYTGNTLTTLYFAGGMYEIQDSGGGGEKIIRYYGIAGQRVAIYDGTNLEYMLTDQQGSTMAVLDDTGAIPSDQR